MIIRLDMIGVLVVVFVVGLVVTGISSWRMDATPRGFDSMVVPVSVGMGPLVSPLDLPARG